MAEKTRKRTYLVTSGRMVLRLTEAKEGGFVVTSPLDPELVTQAESITEAFDNASDAARMLRQARVKLLARLKSKARAG
jgi:predicted RNase H-like HicB family nuclease